MRSAGVTSSSFERVAVLWLRRDLRVHDHPALVTALASARAVVPVFVLDPRLLDGPGASANRTWFLLGTLRALAQDLEARGAPLVVRTRAARGRDPGSRRRGRGRRRVRDPRREPVRPTAGRGGRRRARRGRAGAFTSGPGSWWRSRRRCTRRTAGRSPSSPPSRGAGQPCPAARCSARRRHPLAPARRPGRRPAARGPAADRRSRPPPDPGRGRGARRLVAWAASAALPGYAEGRNRLDADGTSRLSADLKFGTLSPLEVLLAAEGPGEGRRVFASELCWREFYAPRALALPARGPRRATGLRSTPSHGSTTRPAWRPGGRAAPATRSWTPRCASSPRAAGCTTGPG